MRLFCLYPQADNVGEMLSLVPGTVPFSQSRIALSRVRLETALADSLVFVMHVAGCISHLRALHQFHSTTDCLSLFVVWTLKIQTAANLRLHASAFGVQTKSWQQRYILPPKLGIATSRIGGARDL
jgi:hypothetical protein